MPKFASIIFICATILSAQEPGIKIGSKNFTESVILGEIAKYIADASDINAIHREQLGGTRVLWNALIGGEIDIYPEYTGTITQEIFAGEEPDENEIIKRLKESGIRMSEPLGFNNTYALGMKKERAEELGINKISDLNKYPQLEIAFSNEFMDRGDGWQALRRFYQMPHENVNGVDHDIAYRGLENDAVDVIDLYSTDAEIEYYDIKVLEDDKKYFPRYDAVFLYTSGLQKKYPEYTDKINSLCGAFPESRMIELNSKVKIKKMDESKVAADFVNKRFGTELQFKEESFRERFARNTVEHMYLVAVSLSTAIILAIPIGILAYRKEKFGNIILSAVGIIQTIPSLALLVFMVPLFGIGSEPAIAALFLYSLLPIVRNTYLGFEGINKEIRESAEVLGLTQNVKMFKIELPLASLSILSGIKTSAVINVGTATLGALIGSGGYGQPILTGIRLDNIPLVLEGAVPAALLAVGVQSLFDLSEKIFVPKGIRIKN